MIGNDLYCFILLFSIYTLLLEFTVVKVTEIFQHYYLQWWWVDSNTFPFIWKFLHPHEYVSEYTNANEKNISTKLVF